MVQRFQIPLESRGILASSFPTISDQDPEIKSQGQANQTTMVSKESSLDSMIQRYSSWYKLKRAVAWLLQFRECMQRKLYPRQDALPQAELSLEELKSVELHIIRYVQTLSAFHLNGKIGFPGGKPNGTGLSTGNFSKKRNTFRGIPLFSFSPELPENHCTICFITLVPCSLVKICDFARENGVVVHVSVSNMRFSVY